MRESTRSHQDQTRQMVRVLLIRILWPWWPNISHRWWKSYFGAERPPPDRCIACLVMVNHHHYQKWTKCRLVLGVGESTRSPNVSRGAIQVNSYCEPPPEVQVSAWCLVKAPPPAAMLAERCRAVESSLLPAFDRAFVLCLVGWSAAFWAPPTAEKTDATG